MSSGTLSSSAVHVVDIETKIEHLLCSGYDFKLIDRGDYYGKLIVLKLWHYFDIGSNAGPCGDGTGSFTEYYLVNEEYKEIKDLCTSDEGLNQY